MHREVTNWTNRRILLKDGLNFSLDRMIQTHALTSQVTTSCLQATRACRRRQMNRFGLGKSHVTNKAVNSPKLISASAFSC